MSYILEALRRAESERARGRAPGLHDPVLPPAGGDAPQRRTGAYRVVIGALLLVTATLALLATFWRPAARVATTTGALASAAAFASTAAPASPAVPTEAAPASAAPPAATPPSHAAPAQLRKTPAPGGAAARAMRSTPASAAPGQALSPEPRVLRLADLSAAQRAALPPMAIGGAIYSEAAASRFVLVNGQVVREGETAAPGVTLERIGPKAVTLRWRELRIEVPY